MSLSEFDQKYLNQAQQKEVLAATRRYDAAKAAGDQAGMAAANRQAEAVRAAGLPAGLSLSAGSYVCNDVMYTLLRRLDGTDAIVGFIHLPLSSAQAEGRTPPPPSMEISDMARGLEAAIIAAAEYMK